MANSQPEKSDKTVRFDATRAAAWQKWFDITEAGDRIASERLLELAAVGPGSHVLDIATGIGEPALTAARAVGPDGRVLATDLSPDMLAVAQERARQLGLANVDFRVMDANAVDMPDASFDAALCRLGLMFVSKLDEMLTRIRQCLKPNGRFAAFVWGDPAEAPAVSLANRVVLETLGLPPPDEGPGTPFALRDSEALCQRAASAGFSDVTGEWISIVYEFESPEAFAEFRRARAGKVKRQIAHLPEDRQDAAWQAVAKAAESYLTADGHVRMANRGFCLVVQR